MRVYFFFAWYDFWIGFFYDRAKKILYFCPLPCCVFQVAFGSVVTCNPGQVPVRHKDWCIGGEKGPCNCGVVNYTVGIDKGEDG